MAPAKLDLRRSDGLNGRGGSTTLEINLSKRASRASHGREPINMRVWRT